jgi:hypothetical protein
LRAWACAKTTGAASIQTAPAKNNCLAVEMNQLWYPGTCDDLHIQPSLFKILISQARIA